MEKHKESIGENCQNGILNAKTSGTPRPNVPALRFPEFADKWEKGYFKDVCKITTGNKNTQDKDENGLYPFYVRSQNIERINSWTFDGEAILTAGDGVGVGKVFHYSIGKIGVHQRVYILSNFKCDGKYLYQYFSSRFYNRVKRMSAKNSVDSVRMEMIADMPLYLPSVGEQHKIGKLLALLDERISTQNKIIEDLRKLKSALYQEMFRSLVAPTLKLGQVAEIVKGKQVNGTELLEQGDYYVMNGGTLPSGWLNKFNTEANTISISEGGNSCGYVQYNTSPYWSGGHCYSLKILHPKKTSDLYLYHFLKWQEENIMALRIGSSLPNIQKKDLLRFPIILPTITQQNKIVSILSVIEEKVSCEISITKYFIKQKEYLLGQLFI